MDLQALQLPPHHQVVLNRFVAACQVDERVVAACLVGSYARGTADAYSDLDFHLITSDDAYADFIARREAFIQHLGEPLFLENFGSDVSLLYILADGTEGELEVSCESQINDHFSGPYRVLVDKKYLLAEAAIPWREAIRPPVEQLKALRQQVYWFWHDLSHFITALGRGQLWWASGQLEALRLYCINLARLQQNFSDPEVGNEGYFKVEQAVPTTQLSPLQATVGSMEPETMLLSADIIVQFYQELASSLAQQHGIAYPAELERVILDRLEKLRTLV